ncbi:hypothetical protein [Chitinophaga barathri]|uniref:Uncharacterized protein n=1 Tax=Chitinophaga barathri TaxID=1647451 RepID=A0A3N4N543_9BACT|nr:hypothetical protein [Chitinophaga barathri]RPD42743.1 hypothetical protein EG028_00135 [Chitinophaga barathri]
MNKFLKIVMALVVIVLVWGYLSSDGCEDTGNVPTDDKYVKNWSSSSEAPIGVARAFVKNNNRDCGEFYIRESKESSGEYLVACSRDGETWNYYIVWASIEKVMGPFSDNITPPR